MPFVEDADMNGFDEEPIPEIGSDLLRGLDDDEEPIDSGPIAIEKLDEELPGAGEHLGDEPADVADEGNGLEDQETEDDEDIPGATLEIGDTDSTKKRNSTPKSAKGAASTAGRKRKADKSDEELPAKRSGRGRATAAAASDAIKTGATKKSRAAAATKAPKTAGAKRGPKPGAKAKKAAAAAEEFEVEGIKDHTVKKGKTLYLVKWKGWSDGDNTWEPEENMGHAADLLKEYEATLEEGMKTGKPAKKAAPAKKVVGPAKTKTKTKKVAPAKKGAAAKAATAKPAARGRGRPGRPKRN